VEQEAPLPNIALLQETPSSTAINPSASPTSLAINENVFEVGPIRDLLVKIKREFAKGRNWGLKPAVFHEMGVVTYSLLLYEKSDIAETEVFRLLLAIPWGILLVFSLSYGPEFILEFMPEFIVKFIPGFIPGFILEFILHLAFTYESRLSILFIYTVPSIITICYPLDSFPKLLYMYFIFILIHIISDDLIAMATGILVFVKSNKFWTHGHLKLRLNDHVYDYTWAAIGTKEFRALELELRATESPIVPGVNEAQKGLLRCAFASLPMEFQSSEV
jgi:hypothetical protein